MSVYLDASVLVALFTDDALSDRAHEAMAELSEQVIVSDYGALEFSSALARIGREGLLTPAKVRSTLADFDLWTARSAQSAVTAGEDVVAATAMVRRFDLSLRGPDALNLAIAERLGGALLTFDAKMKRAAGKLGLKTVG